MASGLRSSGSGRGTSSLMRSPGLIFWLGRTVWPLIWMRPSPINRCRAEREKVGSRLARKTSIRLDDSPPVTTNSTGVVVTLFTLGLPEVDRHATA